MKLITGRITKKELKDIAEKSFGNLVKAVVDTEKKILVIDAELHADEEKFLLEMGSQQKNLWGINLYPELTGSDFIEFDSMINIKPSSGNRARNVENPEIRNKIITIVDELVKP